MREDTEVDVRDRREAVEVVQVLAGIEQVTGVRATTASTNLEGELTGCSSAELLEFALTTLMVASLDFVERLGDDITDGVFVVGIVGDELRA